MIDVGQGVGNYNVTAKLGEGGMGIVFLAEHPVIGSKVALKAIHPHLARNADVVSRFVTEARAVNQIEHEHIVNITDFGNTPQGDFYFIMEYLHGEMLSDGIIRQGALPAGRALNIAAQIADALQAAHDHGVIHRDLKPDNVYLISRDATAEFVKVLDFGLAKLTSVGGATPTHNTGAGTIMGTPYYMSPEQCEGKKTVDHRADIYSLGVILFEMLTGCVPFGGSGYGEVIIKHVTVRAPAARSLVPDLPPAIDAILSRALAKDPDARFQSMADFRAALLEPESYQSPVPVTFTDDDLSGRFRAALPAPRTGMNLASGSARATAMLTPRKDPGATVRDDEEKIAAEIVDDAELKPKRSHSGLFIVAVAALTGVAVASVTVRRKAAEGVVGAVARTRATAERVDFGAVRGKTKQLLAEAVALTKPSLAPASMPTSIAAPSDRGGTVESDAKEAEPPPVVETAAPIDDPPATPASPAASMTVKVRERARHRASQSDLSGDDALPEDDDATLPLSSH